MTQPFFSVIMPVYNVEKHLEAAVRSVQQQTYGDFELLIVDDASPDSSGEIADRLAAEDARIRVIHKPENGGLSLARNTGMEQMTGRYVFFMDSDDTVEETLFTQVAASLEKNPAQVVVFGLVEEYYDANGNLHHSVPVHYDRDLLLTTREALRQEVIHLEEKTLYGYAWNKFYDARYLRSIGLHFEVITLIEDIQFNVQYFMDIERVNILACTPYHYNKRLDGSLTNKFVPGYYELHRKRVEMLYEQYRYWGLLSDSVRRILADIYVRYIFSALQRNCDKRAGLSHKGRKEFIQALYRDTLFKELIAHAQGNSRLVHMMAGWLKGHHTCLCLCGGRGIFIIKNRLPMLFARAKQNR